MIVRKIWYRHKGIHPFLNTFLFLTWAQAKDTKTFWGRDHLMPWVISPGRMDNYALVCLRQKKWWFLERVHQLSKEIKTMITMVIVLISLWTLSLGWNTATWFLLCCCGYRLNDFHSVVMKIRWWWFLMRKVTFLKRCQNSTIRQTQYFISVSTDDPMSDAHK